MWTLSAISLMFFVRKTVWRLVELELELRAVLCLVLVCLIYEVHDYVEFRYQDDWRQH